MGVPLIGMVNKISKPSVDYGIYSMLYIVGHKYPSKLKNSFLSLHQNFDIYVSYLININ